MSSPMTPWGPESVVMNPIRTFSWASAGPAAQSTASRIRQLRRVSDRTMVTSLWSEPILAEKQRNLSTPAVRRRSVTAPPPWYIGGVRLLVGAALAAGAVLAISAFTFLMAVRPPRLAIPGTPREYRLGAEDVTIT